MATTGTEQNAGPPKSIANLLIEFGKYGLGSMAHPETERWIARTVLFAYMEKMSAPDLRNFRTNSLPTYQALFDLGRSMIPGDPGNVPALVIRELTSNGGERRRRHYVTDWSSLFEAAGFIAEAKKLADEISQWTEALNITTDWFRDAVVNNLIGWHIGGVNQKTVTWGYAGTLMELQDHHRIGAGDMRRLHGWRTLDNRVPVPAVKPYNPSTQTREAHRANFASELDHYYEQQEEVFRKAGFRDATPKRARAGTSKWLHFEWFIKYQTRELSAAKIADAEKRDQGLTQDAV